MKKRVIVGGLDKRNRREKLYNYNIISRTKASNNSLLSIVQGNHEEYLLKLKKMCSRLAFLYFKIIKALSFRHDFWNYFSSVKLWTLYRSSACSNFHPDFYDADHLEGWRWVGTTPVLYTEAKDMSSSCNHLSLLSPRKCPHQCDGRWEHSAVLCAATPPLPVKSRQLREQEDSSQLLTERARGQDGVSVLDFGWCYMVFLILGLWSFIFMSSCFFLLLIIIMYSLAYSLSLSLVSVITIKN